ncbi:hypothetical protein KBB27_02445 [Patescibacteria group bacterium]|nr:hypothetical protein [Patescibacteria group bacterium]
MTFFHRLFLAILLITTVFVSRPSPVLAQVSEMRCQCDCTLLGSTGAPSYVSSGGPLCTTPADCTQDACQSYCALAAPPGAVTRPPAGMHVYYCTDAYIAPPPPVPATTEGSGTPAPAGTDASTGTPTTGDPASSESSGSGSARTAADSPSDLGGAVPSASSPLSLRLILPACTANGKCSLTDIINTGIRFANLLIALSGILFLAVFLIAGARLILFAYSGKEVAHTKTMITGAVTGIIIIMIAGVAVRFVSSSLGVSSSVTSPTGRNTTAANRLTPPATR